MLYYASETFLKSITLYLPQGLPNFSGSAHITTQTNPGAQVTKLFEKVATFYVMIFLRIQKLLYFSKLCTHIEKSRPSVREPLTYYFSKLNGRVLK